MDFILSASGCFNLSVKAKLLHHTTYSKLCVEPWESQTNCLVVCHFGFWLYSLGQIRINVSRDFLHSCSLVCEQISCSFMAASGCFRLQSCEFSALLSGILLLLVPADILPSFLYWSFAWVNSGAAEWEKWWKTDISQGFICQKQTHCHLRHFPPCVCYFCCYLKSCFKNHVQIIHPYKEMNECFSFNSAIKKTDALTV